MSSQLVYLEETNEFLAIKQNKSSCTRQKVRRSGQPFTKFHLNRTGFLSPEQRFQQSRQGDTGIGFTVPSSTYLANTKLYSPRQDKFDGYAQYIRPRVKGALKMSERFRKEGIQCAYLTGTLNSPLGQENVNQHNISVQSEQKPKFLSFKEQKIERMVKGLTLYKYKPAKIEKEEGNSMVRLKTKTLKVMKKEKEEAVEGKNIKSLMQRIRQNQSGQTINGLSLPRPVHTANTSVKTSHRTSIAEIQEKRIQLQNTSSTSIRIGKPVMINSGTENLQSPKNSQIGRPCSSPFSFLPQGVNASFSQMPSQMPAQTPKPLNSQSGFFSVSDKFSVGSRAYIMSQKREKRHRKYLSCSVRAEEEEEEVN